MKKIILICLLLMLSVSLVACGEKTDSDTQTAEEAQGTSVAIASNESATVSSDTISDADLIIEVAKRYMTAVEQNDTHTMSDCMDPNLQGTAEGTADILGNLLGVGDVADTAISAQGYFAQATLESLGLTLEYTFAGIEGNPVVNKNDATITLVYDLFATDGTKEISAPLIAEFELLKMGEDWYLKAEPVVTVDEESLTMKDNGEIVTNFGTGAYTDEYELDTQPSYGSLESEYMYAFSQGYAIVELSSIKNQDMKDFMAIIDETGVIQGTIPDNYSVRSSVHDGALLVCDGDMYALLSVDGSVMYEFPENTAVVSRESTIPHLYVHLTERSYTGDTTTFGIMDFSGNWIIEPLAAPEYYAILPEGVSLDYTVGLSNRTLDAVELTYINESICLVGFSDSANSSGSLLCIKRTDSEFLEVDSFGVKSKDLYYTDEATLYYTSGLSGRYELYEFDFNTCASTLILNKKMTLSESLNDGLVLATNIGYYNLNAELVIDFDNYPTMQDKSDMAAFQYGYVPIIMNGYYTLLDTQGNFAFEPKEFGADDNDVLSWMMMISEDAFLNLNNDTITSIHGEILFEIPKDCDVKIINDSAILLQSDDELIYIDEYGVPLF